MANRLLMVVVLIASTAAADEYQEDALLCDGATPIGKAFARSVYRQYPFAYSKECLNLQDLLGAIDSEQEQNQLIARCALEDARAADQAAGVNARLPAALRPPFFQQALSTATPTISDFYADYTLVVDPSSAGGDGKSSFFNLDRLHTAWTSIALPAWSSSSNNNKNMSCSVSDASALATPATCATHSLLLLPSLLDSGGGLVGLSLAFGADTLWSGGGQQSLSPDLVYSTAVRQSAFVPGGKVVRVALPGRDMAWALVMQGCALPTLRVRVRWHLDSEVIGGASVTRQTFPLAVFTDAATGRTRARCWRRTLEVLSIVESDILQPSTAMECAQRGVDSNTLRHWLADPANGATAALRRASALAYVVRQTWATSYDGRTLVLFPAAYAKALLDCAQPGGSGVLMGGRWAGFSPGLPCSGPDASTQGSPGVCVACAAAATAAATVALQSTNQRMRACNRTLPSERLLDCCVGCVPGYLPLPASSGTSTSTSGCALACAPGMLMVLPAGQCAACPAGTYSLGGAVTACSTCAQLGFGANAYTTSTTRGCVACGAFSAVVVAVGVGGCVPCALGTFVAPGASVCAGCAGVGPGLYAPSGATACVGCPAGTYLAQFGATFCALCPANTYAPRAAATVCRACAAGARHTPNRTACVPCSTSNSSVPLYVQYYAPGCAVRCDPLLAHPVRANLFAPGGCASCAALAVPVGAYMDNSTCATFHACTNLAGVLHAYYTGASARRGWAGGCPWACNAGYYVLAQQCQPCAKPGFNAAVHRYLPTNSSTCVYTCKPYVYVDLPALACTTPCNYLVSDAQGGRLLAPRVRDYTGLVSLPSPTNPRGPEVLGLRPRPRYIQGVCGAAEAAPNSALPFLRRGTYAYLSPTPVAPPLACGNALLDVGELCDDGNSAGGDGCSAACTVESSSYYYWDCDLIGTPCLPNCGWQVDATATWGIGLRGFVLPACPGGVCLCANLAYYDVQRLPSASARAAWMAANLVSCGCGGNAQRMLPYANCTAANRGCRQCPAGQYHDDSLSQCVACGSRCLPGFMPSAAGRICGSAISTSDLMPLLQTNASYAQLAIGCVPCAAVSAPVRYLRGCVFACYRGGASSVVAGTQVRAYIISHTHIH